MAAGATCCHFSGSEIGESLTHFKDQYDALRLPIGSADEPGLYRNQLGAVHAIASHFTLQSDSAIISMPTGSGKTAVLVATPYVLQSSRVLVITPSKLVRSQIAEEFAVLARLKAVGCFAPDAETPKTREVKHQISTKADWSALKDFDVVVGTPNCVAPGLDGIPKPAKQLFDLILVDEAHHAPAESWNRILEAFPTAKRVLFTATPFRRDRREIKGRLVYVYPTRQAYDDKVFGALQFVPVADGPNLDERIAAKAAAVLAADRKKGLKHCLLARAGSREDANRLKLLYSEKTKLKLAIVHSGYSQRTILGALAGLADGSIDGVVAVDMLSEGFDFPRLKVAAIHQPHKSLPVTLQFIGRFARTNDPEVGAASFVGAPSDEMDRWFREMYREDAVWREIIPSLADAAIGEEAGVRQALGEFTVDVDLSPEADISLYSIEPYHHVSVWSCLAGLAVTDEFELPEGLRLVHREHHQDKHTSIIVAAEATYPRWDKARRFANTVYHVVLLYFDSPTKLLFINSSYKSKPFYTSVADQLSKGTATRLSLAEVKRALRPLTNTRAFHVGMRNTAPASAKESYVTKTGSSAELAISAADGENYNLGHVFVTGVEGADQVTRGVSSQGKIWSNKTERIPAFVSWCRGLAKQLASKANVVTGTPLDLLDAGQLLVVLPHEEIVGVDWPTIAYRHGKQYRYSGGAAPVEGLLADLDIRVDRSASTPQRLALEIVGASFAQSLWFEPFKTVIFRPAAKATPGIEVLSGTGDHAALAQFLCEHPTVFFTGGFSRIERNQIFERRDISPFEAARIKIIDWTALGADIQVECGPPGSAASAVAHSIHATLANELLGLDPDILLYDHGPGEVADFVAIDITHDVQSISLYHCKASAGEDAGARLDDVYEVAGQVAKCVHWISRMPQFVAKIRDRALERPDRLLQGDQASLKNFMSAMRTRKTRYKVVLVQPGLSAARLNDRIGRVLGAADAYVRHLDCLPLEVIASA